MPNVFDALGLQVRTREELETLWTSRYQTIYGADVNLAADTPDGQMMQLKIQDTIDLQDLLVAVNASFDPDQAVGKILDQRIAINGIQRQGGTYTETNITLVTTVSANFFGIDQGTFDSAGAQIGGEPIYTVRDNEGNRYWLMATELGLAPGTHVLAFRAELAGQVLTTPNTINTPVTVVLGVASINNPTAYTTLGENEESDANAKVRRQKSVTQASQGFAAALTAALENVTGVTAAFVHENDTSATDDDGVPGHSIWVIVAGSATDADIANTINRKRNEGCGMFGDKTYVVTMPDGSPFLILWDEAVARALFIRLTLTSIDGVVPVNYEGIQEQLPELLAARPNESVNTTSVGTLVQQIDPNALVTLPGLSSAELQLITPSGTAASGAFKFNYNGEETNSIAWNASGATIQAEVEALTGLEDVIISGSLAGLMFICSLLDVPDGPQALLYITDNTLQTGGAVPITFTYNENYQNLLEPSSKKYQFALTSTDIILLPMLLLPATSLVSATDVIEFSALGGYRDKVFSVVTSTGSTIDPVTGVYTAGTTGTDTVRAEDGLGNFATATVDIA